MTTFQPDDIPHLAQRDQKEHWDAHERQEDEQAAHDGGPDAGVVVVNHEGVALYQPVKQGELQKVHKGASWGAAEGITLRAAEAGRVWPLTAQMSGVTKSQQYLSTGSGRYPIMSSMLS